MGRILNEIKRIPYVVRGKGAFDILAGTLLIRIVSFFGSLILVRLMVKAEYGVLSYMENLYSYAFLFAGYGLNNAALRYSVKAESIAQKKSVFLFALKHGTVFNMILVVVLGVAAFLYPHAPEFAQARSLLPIMLTAIVFSYLTETCSVTFRALFMNRAFAVVALASVISIWTIKIVGNEIAGLDGAVLSWPVTYAVLSIVLIAYFMMKVFRGVEPELITDRKKREIQKYSIQFMITNGLWALFMQNDVLFIGMLTASPEMVAEYKVAYFFPAAIGFLSSAINIFVVPYFVKHETEKQWVWRNYKRTLLVAVLSTGIITIGLLAFSPAIVELVFGADYLAAVPTMRVLLVALFVGNAFRSTTANLIAAMGQVRVNLAIAAGGIVIQVVADIALIPAFGTIGAALGSLIVYAVMSVAVIAAFVVLYRPRV